MSVSSHLAVQRNAFSTAQAAAKVCDGAASASIAERISNVQIVNSPKGQSAFLLFPSITGHTWTHAARDPNNTTSTTVSVSNSSQNAVLNSAAYTQTCLNTIHAFAGVTYGAITLTGTVTTAEGMQEDADNDPVEMTLTADQTTLSGKKIASLVKKKDAPDEFRLVSAAMRLSCINAADQMSGWFEAIRIRPSWSVDGMVTYEAGSGSDKTWAIGPNATDWEEGILASSNWSNDPSYVTGRLRDLGRHTFYLQPVKPRKFHRWPASVNTLSFDDYEEQPCGFDTTFDCVAVRIYSSASSTPTLQQSIHCHTVKNWETMYDSNKSMARFHTSTISAKKAVEYADKQMTRDTKASMIRSASAYGYRY